jgi:hypothetical protein
VQDGQLAGQVFLVVVLAAEKLAGTQTGDEVHLVLAVTLQVGLVGETEQQGVAVGLQEAFEVLAEPQEAFEVQAEPQEVSEALV